MNIEFLFFVCLCLYFFFFFVLFATIFLFIKSSNFPNKRRRTNLFNEFDEIISFYCIYHHGKCGPVWPGKAGATDEDGSQIH
jgi:hypothetical protein